MIGEVLDGRYEIVSFIGQGGMSLVYKAMHLQLNRPVAIKFLKPEFMGDISNVQRFKREAQAASAVQHPNVNAVYAVGITADGQPYLVLEYLAGRSLSVVIANEKPLPIERAVRIFAQVLDGLAQAHARGIIHRDLKPSNIVLTVEPDGQEIVKVVDFGLAKLLPQFEGQQQQLTQAGEVLGTLLYMSPEQKRGKPIDARADLYAVAYMLFEAVSAEGIIPQQLRDFIDRGVEEDPGKRFQTAEEMREALQAALKSDGTGPTYRADSRGDKQLALAGVLLAVVLLVVAGGGLVAWNSPATRKAIQFNWLRLQGAPKDEIAKAGLDWANTVQEQNKDAVGAAVILQRDLQPMLGALSQNMQGKVLYAVGHNLLLQGRPDYADRIEVQLNDLVYDVKHSNSSADLRALLCDRWKLTRETDLVPPMNRKKLFELRKVAGGFASHGFYDEADRTWTAAREGAEADPQLRSLEPAILSEWAESCIQHPRNNEMLFAIGERWYRSLQEQHAPIDATNYGAAALHASKLAADGDFRQADQTMAQVLPVVPEDDPAAVTYLLFASDICTMRNSFDRATDYAQKALDKAQKLLVSPLLLGRAYATVGQLYAKQDQLKEAIPYLNKALSLGGDSLLDGSGMKLFSAVYVRCLDSQHAVLGEKYVVDRTLGLAATQSKEQWRDRGLSMMARQLAASLIAEKRWDEAIRYATESLQFADSPAEERDAKEFLTRAYSRAGKQKTKKE